MSLERWNSRNRESYSGDDDSREDDLALRPLLSSEEEQQQGETGEFIIGLVCGLDIMLYR